MFFLVKKDLNIINKVDAIQKKKKVNLSNVDFSNIKT